MRKSRNKKPSEVDNTRLTLTTTLRALRHAVNRKMLPYRTYMEIAKALGGAKKHGRDTSINFRWIVDNFPTKAHVVLLQFCEGQRARLLRQLLYALCRDVAEELMSLDDCYHPNADRCVDYFRAALAGDAFNSRSADARIRHIEFSFSGALRRFCRHTYAFLWAARKRPDDFDVLYPHIIGAVNNFIPFMDDGNLVERLVNPQAPKAWEFMRRALVSFLRPRKA
jgi:hypothetical protein